MSYSKEEINILKRFYPVIGMKVQQFLPERSKASIDHQVRNMDIKYGLFEIGEEAYLDIETTNLNADFAFMLSYCLKVKGKDEVIINSITREEVVSGELDKRLVGELITDIRKFKRIYTYYGTRFDIPFCRTRALVHGYEFIPFGLIQHQDLYFLVRNKMKLSRNRLDNICNILEIEGKTHLDPMIWIKAAIGNTEAIKYITIHNEADVRILEKVHNKIKDYAGVTRSSL